MHAYARAHGRFAPPGSTCVCLKGGSAPLTIKCATRWASVLVLPEPAPAITRSGTSACNRVRERRVRPPAAVLYPNEGEARATDAPLPPTVSPSRSDALKRPAGRGGTVMGELFKILFALASHNPEQGWLGVFGAHC